MYFIDLHHQRCGAAFVFASLSLAFLLSCLSTTSWVNMFGPLQMTDKVAPEVLVMAREHRQTTIDALKSADFRDVRRLEDQYLDSIKDVNHKAAGVAILQRNVSSTDPSSIVSSLGQISISPVTQDNLITLYQLSNYLDASAYLKCCATSIRTEAIDYFLSAAILGEMSRIKAIPAFCSTARYFAKLAMTLLRYPELCEALIIRRKNRSAQDKADLQTLLERGVVDASSGIPSTLFLVMISAALGYQLQVPPRLVLSLGKTNAIAGIASATARLKLIEDNASLPTHLKQRLTRNPCYTCTNCGKFAIDIIGQGQRDLAKAFKSCSNCGQMYCSTACQTM